MTMSNGGGEIERGTKRLQEKSKVGGSDFDLAVAKIAVAQICESLGFQGFQQSALETLSDIAVRYIHNLGKTIHSSTSLAGRTESNAFDVVQGLEDLGSGLGFVGSSDPDHCLASSGMAMDIVNYVQDADNIPFAYSLPRFPVTKKRKLAPSFCQNGEDPPNEYIPSWLPAFPGPPAVSNLKEGNEMENGLQRNIPELAGEEGEKERSLKNSQGNSTFDMLAGPSAVSNAQDANGAQTAVSNPFLAQPLRFGEKEVSVIVPPAKISVGTPKSLDPETNSVSNHVTVQETRSPVAELMKNCLSDSEQRPLIRFKLGSTKKTPCPDRDLASLEGRGLEKTSTWFREDEDEEWKKTKIQKIVAQSDENRTEQFKL